MVIPNDHIEPVLAGICYVVVTLDATIQYDNKGNPTRQPVIDPLIGEAIAFFKAVRYIVVQLIRKMA